MLIIVADSEESLMEKVKKQVNIGKTKLMKCKVGIGAVEETDNYPCVM